MRPAEEALLERALAAEGEADSLAARRDWAGAAAALSQAADLLKSRQAALRTDAPPLYCECGRIRAAAAACGLAAWPAG